MTDTKCRAAAIRPGDRVFVVRTDTAGRVIPASRKRGATRATVRAVTKLTGPGGGHFGTVSRSLRYRIETTAGEVLAGALATFTLAEPRPYQLQGATVTTSAPKTAETPTPATPSGAPTVECPACGRAVRGRRDGSPVKHVCTPADTETKTAPVKTAPPAPAPDLPAGIPADAPGAAKAARLFVGAAESRWTATAVRDGDAGLVVTLRAGEATIVVTFADGKLDLDRMPAYVRDADAKPCQLKNVSAALAVMSANPAPVSIPPAAKARSRKATPQAAAA